MIPLLHRSSRNWGFASYSLLAGGRTRRIGWFLGVSHETARNWERRGIEAIARQSEPPVGS